MVGLLGFTIIKVMKIVHQVRVHQMITAQSLEQAEAMHPRLGVPFGADEEGRPDPMIRLDWERCVLYRDEAIFNGDWWVQLMDHKWWNLGRLALRDFYVMGRLAKFHDATAMPTRQQTLVGAVHAANKPSKGCKWRCVANGLDCRLKLPNQ